VAEPEGRADYDRHGYELLPIVARGEAWIAGQSVEEVAKFLGFTVTIERLPPDELARRVDAVLQATQRMARQLPEDKLRQSIPLARPRERSYIDLVSHIGLVVECLPELLENGRRLDAKHYKVETPAEVRTRADLIRFIAGIQTRFDAWWARSGETTDYQAKPDVFYDEPTVHSYFERTTWHAAQHARQLAAALEELGIAPDGPLTEAELAGLPVPDSLFD
jgi:hypothetical protein